MEHSILDAGNQSIHVQEPNKNKDKQEARKNTKSNAKPKSNQSLAVSSALIKVNFKDGKREMKPNIPIQSQDKKKISLKEKQERKYPFSDSDVSRMFDELLKAKLLNSQRSRVLVKLIKLMIQIITSTIT